MTVEKLLVKLDSLQVRSKDRVVCPSARQPGLSLSFQPRKKIMDELYFVQMTTVQGVITLVTRNSDGSAMVKDDALTLLELLERDVHNTSFAVVLVTWL